MTNQTDSALAQLAPCRPRQFLPGSVDSTQEEAAGGNQPLSAEWQKYSD